MTAAIEPEENGRTLFQEFTDDPSKMPATVAQQLFSIVPGIAGGLTGLFLAGKLANVTRVKTSGVIMAAVANAVLTFLTVFLIVEADEIEPVE